MPCYLMTHPENGQHICYTPEDVEAHRLIGWVPLDEAKPETTLRLNPERKKPGRNPKVKQNGD